jgi:3-polyprenyl-4-hydroxybenzoate decarboxylase
MQLQHVKAELHRQPLVIAVRETPQLTFIHLRGKEPISNTNG